MRSLEPRFDPKKVASLPPSPKPHAYGKLGLYVQANTDGTRRWVQKVSISGRGRWLDIGDATTIAWRDVEAAAVQNRATAKRGKDPQVEKLRAKKADERSRRTVSDVMKAMREAKAPALSERTRQSQGTRHRHIDNHAIGKTPIVELDIEAVVGFLRPLLLSRPATGEKVKRGLQSAWAFARASGWVDATAPNPCDRDVLKHLLPAASRIRKPTPHRAPGWEAAPEFWKALAPYSGTGASALKLALLCGTRSNETLNAEWREFDLTARTWTLPAERTKQRRELVIPLSDAALNLLIELKAVARGALLLPSYNAKVPASSMVMLVQLSRMGWRDRLAVS